MINFMIISEAPAYCANCGTALRLSIRPNLDMIPKLVPSFCSEKCAREYLMKDEMGSLR
jgi:hypothetical protein